MKSEYALAPLAELVRRRSQHIATANPATDSDLAIAQPIATQELKVEALLLDQQEGCSVEPRT